MLQSAVLFGSSDENVRVARSYILFLTDMFLFFSICVLCSNTLMK